MALLQIFGGFTMRSLSFKHTFGSSGFHLRQSLISLRSWPFSLRDKTRWESQRSWSQLLALGHGIIPFLLVRRLALRRCALAAGCSSVRRLPLRQSALAAGCSSVRRLALRRCALDRRCVCPWMIETERAIERCTAAAFFANDQP